MQQFYENSAYLLQSYWAIRPNEPLAIHRGPVGAIQISRGNEPLAIHHGPGRGQRGERTVESSE